jgi:hypothetical protein
MNREDQYFHLYNTALRTVWLQSYSPEQWAEAAATVALTLLSRAKPTGFAEAAPGLPAVLPEGHKASGFGPAFTGWPEDQLRRCLMAIQAIVLAREFGAPEEAHKQNEIDLNAAIGELQSARAAERAAKKPA